MVCYDYSIINYNVYMKSGEKIKFIHSILAWSVIAQNLNNNDLMKWKISCPISLAFTMILSTCIIIKFRLAVFCTLLTVCLCLECYIVEPEELAFAISIYMRIILYFSAHDSTDLPGRKMFKYN